MSNNCRDCNRFQTPQTSTAPDRPAIQPPTMYDHFPNFQKFQQFKEEKAKFEVEQRELAEANKSNFTDFREEVETISENVLSDFTSYRQQSHNAELVNGAGNSNNLNEFPTAEDKDVSAALKPIEKNTSLLTNSTPVICPISECNRLQDVKSILSHYLQDHSQVGWREIFLGKSSKLLFDPDAMDYGENICFGVLAYGGNANDR